MHRVKGLEFEDLIIAGANKDTVPLSLALAGTNDSTVKRKSEFQERVLVYVASTRARRALLVTSFGAPSEFFSAFATPS